MIAYADFIARFPEFSDTAMYPQAQVELWIPNAYAQLNRFRFGSQLDLAACYFVAHNMVLYARAAKTAAAGGVVGQASGPLSQKSVGPVSASYDTQAQAIEKAGPWNATVYGQQLYEMMRRYSRGPFYAPGAQLNYGRLPYPTLIRR